MKRSAGYLAYLAREHDRRARRARRELERRARQGDGPAIFALNALKMNRPVVQMLTAGKES